ncbi:hypothetical protein WH47_08830, partial [Habropoda laboriosa]
ERKRPVEGREEPLEIRLLHRATAVWWGAQIGGMRLVGHTEAQRRAIGGIAHLGAASIRRGDSSKETGPHLARNFFLPSVSCRPSRFFLPPRSCFSLQIPRTFSPETTTVRIRFLGTFHPRVITVAYRTFEQKISLVRLLPPPIVLREGGRSFAGPLFETLLSTAQDGLKGQENGVSGNFHATSGQAVAPCLFLALGASAV